MDPLKNTIPGFLLPDTLFQFRTVPRKLGSILILGLYRLAFISRGDVAPIRHRYTTSPTSESVVTVGRTSQVASQIKSTRRNRLSTPDSCACRKLTDTPERSAKKARNGLRLRTQPWPRRYYVDLRGSRRYVHVEASIEIGIFNVTTKKRKK